MEGPVLLPAAWLFAIGCAWVYRRTERIAPRSPDFEAWAARAPVVLRVSCRPGSAPSTAASLSRELGRDDVVATLGRPPTPFYRLALTVDVHGDQVALAIRRATIRRAHAAPRPLLTIVRDALQPLTADLEQVWLEERIFQDTIDDTPAPHGWYAELRETGWRLARADERGG